ncbi:peptidylprolyl isomerase [Actinacidiphila glaucinigra]|uniref:peptidylprolyl isomerase n=1 Tax=Actinacidiphila glaucinigra TaxID=235986 RepID=UPI00324C4D3F
MSAGGRRPGGSRKPGARKASAARRSVAPPPTAAGRGRLSRRVAAVSGAACLAVAALVAGTVTAFGGQDHGDEVASLDGHPVTREELLFHMDRLAPTVQNELRNTYPGLKTSFSWNTKAGNRTALQRLQTRALAEIREDKTTLLLAQQQGLVGSVDFADLEAERTAENTSRAEAVAAGRTVYGVTDYSPDEYYGHRLTELATDLKDRLSKSSGDPLHVTDAEVRKAYDDDPDSWNANATTYTYTRLVVQVPGKAGADFDAKIARRVKAAGDLSDVNGVADAEVTTDTYGGDGTTSVNTHDQDLMSVLGDLKPGEISEPEKGGGQITYYQLDSKKTNDDKAFSDYRSRIRQSLVEKKYDGYLQRRANDASMRVDHSAMAAINAKDVHQ